MTHLKKIHANNVNLLVILSSLASVLQTEMSIRAGSASATGSTIKGRSVASFQRLILVGIQPATFVRR